MGRRIFGILVSSILLISALTISSSSASSELLYPPWDINQDGKVDDIDINLLKNNYRLEGEPGWIPEDINDDGIVNYLDVSALVSHYGEVYILNPDEMIDDLINEIKSLNLPRGIENSLVRRLLNAKKNLANENIDPVKAKLNSTINHIKALQGKKIAETDANSLIDSINCIIDIL